MAPLRGIASWQVGGFIEFSRTRSGPALILGHLRHGCVRGGA